MSSDLAKSYSLEVLNTITKIELIVEQWQRLYESETEASKAFLSPAWIMPWLRVHKQATPYFVCIYHHGQLIAVAPLVIEKMFAGSVKCLRIAGSSLSQYQGLMLSGPSRDGEISKLILDHIVDQNPVHIVHLTNVPDKSDFSKISNTYTRQSNALYCSILDLKKDLQVRKNARSIVKRAKKEANRKIRKLSASGQLSFSILDKREYNFEELATIMFGWKQVWLKEKALYSGFYDQKNNHKFLSKLIANDFNENNEIVIASIIYKDTPIAIAMGLVKSSTFHCYLTAHNPKFSDYSPGTILFSKILEWMKEFGLDRYDFLGYPEAYKTRFSNEKIDLMDIWLPLTFRGKLAMWAMQINMAQRIKTQFYKLPISIRKFILLLRNSYTHYTKF